MNNNIQKGKIKRWNDNRGFGFIGPEDGGGDIFIHISALKNMSRRPSVGDVIFYQVQTQKDGKKRAVDASIEGVEPTRSSAGRTDVNTQKSKRWLTRGVILALLVVVVFVAYRMLTSSS